MNDPTHFADAVQAPARFTIEEFMRLVDLSIFEGSKVELDQGVIVRMNSAQSAHLFYQRQVQLALHDIFERDRGDRVVYAELSLQIGEATLRDADVGVITPFRPGKDFADPSKTLLVVEISVSTLDYDLNVKRLDYARAGIPHCWVVDVEGRQVHLLSDPREGDYAERCLVAFGESLAVPETDRTIVID